MSACSLTPTKFLLIAIPILMVMLSGIRLKTKHSPILSKPTSMWNQIAATSEIETRNGQVENSRHQVRTILDQVTTLQSKHQKKNSVLIPEYNPSKGFVLNLRYPGQQGAGVRALASFQCFLGSLTPQLFIAEPYLEDTKLRGVTSSPNRLKLSSLFDFDHFNAKSRQVGNPELINVDDFISSRPKPVILINVEHNRSNTVIWKSPQVVQNNSRDGHKCLQRSDITALTNSKWQEITYFMEKLSELESKEACIVRVLELDTRNKSLNHTSIQKLIFGEWLPQEVTLVFDYWSGPYFIPIPSPANGMNCKRNFRTNGTRFQFKPSQRLIHDAEKYRNAYLGGEKKVAVMMRIEKVTEEVEKMRKEENEFENQEIKHMKGITGVIDRYTNGTLREVGKCFTEIQRLKKMIDQDSKTMPLVTMDVGDYGSDSFRAKTTENILRLSNKTLMALYNNKWTMREWEKSFVDAAGGETNKAYIAALQRTLASTAECLILLGGGNFQVLALQDYLRHRHESVGERGGEGGGEMVCVHVACMVKRNDALIRRVLGKHYPMS